MTELTSLLLQQTKALNLSISNEQVDQLMAYLSLLVKWNKAYNLTAIRDPKEMVSRHLIDSLSVLPYVKGKRLIDVGSGPGLPGIPLAICLPDLEVTTLDSNGKKTRFQQQVKMELGLNNLEVIHSRVEKLDVPAFDMVISRAFASLRDMLVWTGHLAAEKGVFLAMKGQYPEDELTEIPKAFTLRESHRLGLPDNDAERHLLILGRA